jgi:MTH538 TIR-like domain (DUF1863)
MKHIFISFDWHHDRHYRYLLAALAKNPRFLIDFDDVTPSEIQSNDIGRIKAALTQKIINATHALVVIGEYANSYHPDRAEIGERNWQWWEIKKSIEKEKRLVAVKIKATNPTPEPLYNANAKWVYSFTVNDIQSAIDAF